MRPPLAITLKDGSQALLRRVTPDDSPDILRLEHEVVRDGRGMVRAESDLPPSVEAHRKALRPWVANEHPDDYGLMLVVEATPPREADLRILGAGYFRRFKPAKIRHVVQVSLEVHPAAQGLGVGRAIMVGLLDWARAAGVNRVQLNVLADNHRAIALYESLGFEKIGHRRRFARDPDGAERDDLEMGLLLDEAGTRHQA